MYVWRGKTRRDKRNFLSDGSRLWGPAKGSKNMDFEDECLRAEHENTHMEYFFNEIRPIMHKYLDSEGGLEEIGMVVKEFKRIAIMKQLQNSGKKKKKKKGVLNSISGVIVGAARMAGEVVVEDEDHDDDNVVPEEARKRHNVEAVFKRYDEDGSQSLDR
jgi:hypothetical protein